MPQVAHIKVLLKKDYLTLRRNIGFVFAFVVLPLGLMIAFCYLQGLAYNGELSGSLIKMEGEDYYANNAHYTTNKVFDLSKVPGSNITGYTASPMGDLAPFYNQSLTFLHCTGQGPNFGNAAKPEYNKIAIVIDEQNDTLKANAFTFWRDYYLKTNNFLNSSLTNNTDWNVTMFDSVDALINETANSDKQPFCFGIHFKTFDMTTDTYDVEFMFEKQDLPDSNLVAFSSLYKIPDLQNWGKWFKSGAVSLYPYIVEFIAREKMGQDPSLELTTLPISVGYAPMSSESYQDIDATIAAMFAMLFPFFYMIIMLIPFFYLVQNIASEKESKAREGMRMMGLQDGSYYVSWFIIFTAIVVMQSLIITVVLGIGALNNVNMVIFFLFSCMYSLTLYGVAFFIVAILPTRRSSVIAASLYHFITYLLTKLMQDPATPSSTQYILSIFPNVCMNQCVKLIFFYNFNTSSGLTWSNLSLEYQGFSFSNGLMIMFIDFVLWTSLGLYLDQILGSQFGVAKPWNFCCVKKKQLDADQLKQGLLDLEGEYENPNQFEPVSDALKLQEQERDILLVRGLRKVFGDKAAVNGVDIKMYNGQIYALLGHNGAGKTTTISMLTGLLEPTAGQAEVFGKSIFGGMDEFRKILGVCPQHDVLFDFLTPEDHLKLFSSFKGTPPELIEGQVKHMLEEIDLVEVKNQLAKTLSGGQKRKLSVAIAMIGNSKVIMLDEPSSGMDTASRRRLWDMLKRNKAGKIIILTTHYMDEADILGDRIAIMAEGKVQCTGSSLFLKNRYGVGYNLVIAKKSRDPAPHIDKFIQERIKTAKKMQEVSSEISYQLPKEESDNFKQFFHDFDDNLENLGIRSYGVGVTTLEEVFLKIGHGEEVETRMINNKEGETSDGGKNINSQNTTQDDQLLEEYSITTDAEEFVFFLHLKALMKKKILMQVRDSKTLAVDTMFPIVLIILGMYLATIVLLKSGVPRDMVVTSIFPDPINMYYNTNSSQMTTQVQMDRIKNFMNDNIIQTNTTAYKDAGGLIIKNVTYEAESFVNIFQNKTTKVSEQMTIWDEAIFGQIQNPTNQAFLPPYYGQLYVQNIDSTVVFDPYTTFALPSMYEIVLLCNTTSQASAGVWGALTHEAILRDYLKTNNRLAGNLNLKFVDRTFPINKLLQGVQSTIAGTNAAFMLTIAWMMISDSLLQNIIKERERNIKHQIMISGSSLQAYWMGHYLSDILFQSIPACTGLLFVKIFSIDVPQVWVLFVLICFANPVFIYAFSFLFSKDESGSFVIKILYFCFGIIAPLAQSFLQISPTTIDISKYLRWIFYPFPIYDLCFGFMVLSQKLLIELSLWSNIPIADRPKVPDEYNNYDTQIAGYNMIFLLLSIPFYWSIVIAFEMKFFDVIFCRKGTNQRAIPPPRTSGVEERENLIKDFQQQAGEGADPDIAEEAARVASCDPQTLPVRVQNIRKKYGNVIAVQDVSFGLSYGECFALLGVSGAGKTTVFKCLTGEQYPTSGSLSINGHDVTTSAGFQSARKMIGYCPQFDAIFEGLTVLEHLQIYASLKGIKEAFRQKLVEKAIVEMDLQDYRNIRANNLSGGNKRKLSVAVAMIGNPPLVFLDEPSTGVDPQAKRFMWNIVSKISTLRKKSAVIITTHSMEEAEALATKMGIMVNGEFKCFGSSQNIKNKYGTGYEIELKIKTLVESETNAILTKNGFDNVGQLDEYQCQSILRNEGWEHLITDICEGGAGEEFHKSLSKGFRVRSGEFIRWAFIEGEGEKAVTLLEDKFKEFKIIEHYSSSWKLKVSRDNFSIGYLFGMMEDIQKEYNISEYSVTQTTLEQIFNNFALEAEMKDGKKGRQSTLTKRRKSSIKDKRNPSQDISKGTVGQ